jgi:hypothetical protein
MTDVRIIDALLELPKSKERRVCLEKLTSPQINKELPVFYGT